MLSRYKENYLLQEANSSDHQEEHLESKSPVFTDKDGYDYLDHLKACEN